MHFRAFKETFYSFFELESIKDEFIEHVCVRSKLAPFRFDIKAIHKYPLRTGGGWALPSEVLAACILERDGELIPYLINYHVMDAFVPFDERRKIEEDLRLRAAENIERCA